MRVQLVQHKRDSLKTSLVGEEGQSSSAVQPDKPAARQRASFVIVAVTMSLSKKTVGAFTGAGRGEEAGGCLARSSEMASGEQSGLERDMST